MVKFKFLVTSHFGNLWRNIALFESGTNFLFVSLNSPLSILVAHFVRAQLLP